jgi:hypothetical protein
VYDTVKVEFMDGTETIVEVHEDEKLHDALAALEDQEGAPIAFFQIICTVVE